MIRVGDVRGSTPLSAISTLYQRCRMLYSASWHKACKFNRVIHNEGTRRETGDFCCVCCALGDLSERAFCLLHISIATLRGRPPFSPFSSPNKSRATLQMLKGLLWNQMGFGVVPSHKREGCCTLNQTHWGWGLRFNWPWFWEDYHLAWKLGNCK